MEGDTEASVGEEHESLLAARRVAVLDALPVYTTVHSVREIVRAAVDTRLTWEQLRTPQMNSYVYELLGVLCELELTRTDFSSGQRWNASVP